MQRGLHCGREEKVLGPKTQLKLLEAQTQQSIGQRVFAVQILQHPNPDDEVTTTDARYLESLCKFTRSNPIPFPPCLNLLSVTHLMSLNPGNDFLVRFAVSWPSFPIDSKPFRYGSLALSSSYVRNSPDPDRFNYLDKFYKYTKEAIEASSTVEVLVASYAVLLCSFRTNEALEIVLRFFNGVRDTSLLFVPDSSNASCDLNAYRTTNSVLLGSVKTLHFAYLKRDLSATEDFDLLWLVHNSLCKLLFRLFVPTSIRSLPIELDLLERLKELDYYMRFYVDLYLCVIEQHGGREVAQVTASLRHILSEIIALVAQMDKSQKVIRDATDESFPWPWLNDRSNINTRITRRCRPRSRLLCAYVRAGSGHRGGRQQIRVRYPCPQWEQCFSSTPPLSNNRFSR